MPISYTNASLEEVDELQNLLFPPLSSLKTGKNQLLTVTRKVSKGAPTTPTYGTYPNQYVARTSLPTQPVATVPEQAPGPASSSQSNRRREPNGRPAQSQSNPNAVRSAAASLENVERAMGDLRDAPRNGRRGNASHGEEIQAGNIHVPAADFDFAGSNAKFDKAALTKPDSDSDSDSSGSDSERGSEGLKTNPSDSEVERKKEKDRKEKEKPKAKETAYNPSKSFFDSLTPNAIGNNKGGAQANRGSGGRGRGRGYGRSRREEEAQRNLMTFGETTPPSYATSWGGRRGSSRRGGYASQGIVANGRPG